MTFRAALTDVKGVILDLDGVIYRGDQAIPGAPEFVDFLRASGRRIVAFTNHSGQSASDYGVKLGRMGVDLTANDVLTSAWATVEYLRKRGRGRGTRVHVLGSPVLKAALLQAGMVESDDPEYVVVGFDRELNFDKLVGAASHLLSGAGLIATNPDPLLPTPSGPIPECGCTVAFLQRASGQRAYVVGKPNPDSMEASLRRLGVDRSEAVVVGDTIETDVAAGRAAGIRTALVLTGNTQAAEEGSATVVARDLIELREAFLPA